jgi:hypothetical protein
VLDAGSCGGGGDENTDIVKDIRDVKSPNDISGAADGGTICLRLSM